MDRNDIFGGAIVGILASSFVLGIILFLWFDNGWWLLMSLLALIVTAAG